MSLAQQSAIGSNAVLTAVFLASSACAKEYNEIAASKLLIDDKSTNVLSQSNPDNHLISLYSGDFKYYNVDLIDFMQQKFNKFKGIPGITYNLKKHHIQFLSKINAGLHKDINVGFHSISFAVKSLPKPNSLFCIPVVGYIA